MFEHVDALAVELDELEARLSEIYAAGDQAAARAAGRRHAQLEAIVSAYKELRSAEQGLEDARELLADETDPEMRTFLEEEIRDKESQLDEATGRLRGLLLPPDPNADRNVIVEIRGAEGGEEASLFAGDLYRMYQRFAERRGWSIEVLSVQHSDMGGFKEVAFLVKGEGVWPALEHEGGPHRVQRVPVTESQGRIHTSAATVAVLPEAEEVDVTIDPNEVEVDVFRATGPGGQSVNTTDSAVRLTHKPTGLVVSCQDEKSQLQNKEKAMRILRARLLKLEQDRQAGELAASRRAQVGGGTRSEKIRTYNFKESRVTDHRIGLTLYKLDQVLDGALDEIVEGLGAAKRAEQLASP